MRFSPLACLLIALGMGSSFVVLAQQQAGAKKKGKAKAGAAKQGPAKLIAESDAAPKAALADRLLWRNEKLQRDFPDLCFDKTGTPWICCIEHDGAHDVLKLLVRTGSELKEAAVLSTPGVIHQPAITSDGGEGVWCFWGQPDEKDVMTLRARRFSKGEAGAEITLAASGGGDSFADAGTDAAGRVWVAWQSMRRGHGDVFARFLDAGKTDWSPERQISQSTHGNWEPRLAFGPDGGTWIAYDSSRGGEFNLYLARIAPDGALTEKQLTSSAEYEARAAICHDGKGSLWIAGERGRRLWGKDLRGHDPADGLNGQKRLLLGRYDIATGQFTEVPVFDRGRPAPIPMPSPTHMVNLPSVAVDAGGDPWLAYRACNSLNWRVVLMKYDAARKQWTEPNAVEDSTMGQDRHNEITRAPDGSLWLCWPSDQRKTKECGISGVHAARVDTAAKLVDVAPESAADVAATPEPAPYLNDPTPERPQDVNHKWTFGGKTYTLCFGDLHRHTDISNCRTGAEGCIAENYRYAYDMADLDFLGTSDHTDVGKTMHPYEWWQTQRQVDAFFSPGKFASLYAYEREQHYPWGHRNIVFAKRGGPVVYIKRATYRASAWGALYPVEAGIADITPMELWDILRRHGGAVSAISHTGATGMGTDWDKYEKIDNTVENVVEIFQGARVSYEGLGTPQPTAGLRQGQKYTADTASDAQIPAPPAAIQDFGAIRNNGVYQRALTDGHKLGVFANSDHISTHTSFGGVYVEEFTREGIIAGFNARRTIAATDKIFIEMSCNGRLMGEVFESKDTPVIELAVDGTAPLKRITLVRNEVDHHTITPEAGAKTHRATFKDDAPLDGENRYYLRIEQSDGNMAWSSPVWVRRR